MVNIGLLGPENVGKRTFLRLFANYLINDEIERGVNDSEFNLVKIDIDNDSPQITRIHKSYKKISPNRVIFQERESSRAHTIFTPSKYSRIETLKMSFLTICRISNLIIPIFSFDQDIEVQLEFFKETRYFPEGIYICFNKCNLFEEDNQERDDKVSYCSIKNRKFN